MSNSMGPGIVRRCVIVGAIVVALGSFAVLAAIATAASQPSAIGPAPPDAALSLTETPTPAVMSYRYLTQFGSPGSGAGQLNYPEAIALDTTGNVYVADTGNNRVETFTSTGTYETAWGGAGSGNGQFNQPHGIAVDSSADVYVADTANNRIQKFTATGAYVTQWGSLGAGNGQFNQPVAVAVGFGGNVYVVDTFNDRVQEFAPDGTYLLQWGTRGSGNGQFLFPQGIAVDVLGNVYVADEDNNRIQVFAADGTYQTAWCTCVGANPAPSVLVTDAAGNVLVSTLYSTTVERYSAIGSLAVQFAVSTTPNVEVSGLAVNRGNDVFVLDALGDRVGVFAPSTATPTPSPTATTAVTPTITPTSTITPTPLPYPDLALVSISKPPAAIVPGNGFSITDTTDNLGPVQANPSSTEYFFQRIGPTPQPTVVLGRRSIPALAPGASSTGMVSVTVPTETAAGFYWLIACADDPPQVLDGNPKNNCLAAPSDVQVTESWAPNGSAVALRARQPAPTPGGQP